MDEYILNFLSISYTLKEIPRNFRVSKKVRFNINTISKFSDYALEKYFFPRYFWPINGVMTTIYNMLLHENHNIVYLFIRRFAGNGDLHFIPKHSENIFIIGRLHYRPKNEMKLVSNSIDECPIPFDILDTHFIRGRSGIYSLRI